MFALFKERALAAVAGDADLKSKLDSEKGVAWRGIIAKLEEALPDTMDNRNQIAASLVKEVLNRIAGANNWETHKPPPSGALYARRKR